MVPTGGTTQRAIFSLKRQHFPFFPLRATELHDILFIQPAEPTSLCGDDDDDRDQPLTFHHTGQDKTVLT